MRDTRAVTVELLSADFRKDLSDTPEGRSNAALVMLNSSNGDSLKVVIRNIDINIFFCVLFLCICPVLRFDVCVFRKVGQNLPSLQMTVYYVYYYVLFLSFFMTSKHYQSEVYVDRFNIVTFFVHSTV